MSILKGVCAMDVSDIEQTFSLHVMLSQCDRELLHLSGRIQAHGALLCFHKATLIVTHISQNIAEFLPSLTVPELGELLPDYWLERLDGYILENGKPLVRERVLETLFGSLDIRIVRHQEIVLVEIERSAKTDDYIYPFIDAQKKLFVMPGNEEELQAYHQTLVRSIREITRFSRVMIYRFHEDLSGEVIAESAEVGLGLYLGLRFPASDIPSVARNLYQVNPCRTIPHVGSAIIDILSLTGVSPDLTFSDLRSVSPAHILYLNNMGVKSSFAVPIMLAGKLWGLIICHHHQPALLSLRERERCVFLGLCYGLGLSHFISNRHIVMLTSLDARIEEVIEPIMLSRGDIYKGLEDSFQRIMNIVSAHGLVLYFGHHQLVFGETLEANVLCQLDQQFSVQKENFMASDHLVDYAPLACQSMIGGVMAIKSYSVKSGWVRLYWLRKSLPQEVLWGGNPNKPVESMNSVISPRKSFEKWVEIRTDYARQWSEEDQAIARMLKVRLLRWL
jgi:two-component system, chemotaxis family, sensor kinase Cph1